MGKEKLSNDVGHFFKEAWKAVRTVAEAYSEEVLREAVRQRPELEPVGREVALEELRPGAHVDRSGQVTFVLFAPGKEKVSLVGSFNEWDQDANPMRETEEGFWWTCVELPKGEHSYQYVVDGNLRIGDPYAREVKWDEGGPKATVQVGKEPYRWHDGEFHPRPLEDLIIYEVHVGDFTPEGTFEAMRKRLDYLEELGVTAIELMPISEFPTDRSWGYNPAFFFAPERAYGDPDDLKRLIDEAHQRGIAVILDMVLNHTQQENPLNQLWPYEDNPYFSGGNPWGMPDFDHYSDVTKTFIRDVQDYWLREYHVDGFRYDATAYIESDTFNGIGFFTWAARQTNPDVYLISEHLPQDPWWVLNTEMDAQWHDTFHDVMKAQLREGEFEGGRQWGDLDAVERALYYKLDGYTHPRQVINYTASHDEQRVVHEALSNPHLNDEIALRKAKLGMTAVIAAAGVPMLYAGEEIGMERERSTGKVEFQWERLESDDAAQKLHKYWKRMAWLRNTHPALRSPNYQTLRKYGKEKVIAFQRWNDDGDVVVIVLNFSNERFTLPVPFPISGEWYEFVLDYVIDADGDREVEIEVLPSASVIFCLWKNW
ncbi:MAG: alpha-amylase family glycosyl hydrolase [Chloroflexota bacterium]|nr:alpha-amylase family glycosyl hydrolase [Chloroflexota bacterium]